MPTTRASRPLESPEDPNPVTRLERALEREGFSPLSGEEWDGEGETIYSRSERVLFVRGETIFVMIEVGTVNEKILRQAVESITTLFRAKKSSDKVLAPFQTTTVYLCLIADIDSPHNESLNRFVTAVGGAVIIPVVIVPEINQVVYPSVEEKVGTVQPRVEFLQYVLGERSESVTIHRNTIKAFYVSAAVVAVLAAGIILSMFV